ncbi:helix-turn-helix domain-containing protein [Apilactobacillus timberlakei]|uniref:helix-turn-helix domain-containing protein n=1 Tax=Apilactobacillus timberlakei TaxID=2008380 RepID=UPI0011288D06|nr:helix-turn-helix transcriptional regulator [Apilactobacillus timberlakei]TPR12147.1 XRE family transcriptional regulator [Apilactobacillus timberlakei]
MNLADKITYLRNQKNITQQQLANLFNVSRTTISSWENNRSIPDLEMVVKICDFFNVTLDYMLRNDKRTLKKISMSNRKKRTFILIIISLVLIILMYIFKIIYESQVSTTDPENIKIVKIKKVPVKIHKDIHGKYIKTDYEYDVYAKLDSLFTTWDMLTTKTYDSVSNSYFNEKNKVTTYPASNYANKRKVFIQYRTRNSLNIFKNIRNNNKVQKLRIPTYSKSYDKRYDKESPYNIGKDIVLYNGNFNSKSNRTIIRAKDNK